MIHILCFEENINLADGARLSSVLISSMFGLIIHGYAKLNLGLQICKVFATKGSFYVFVQNQSSTGKCTIWVQFRI